MKDHEIEKIKFHQMDYRNKDGEKKSVYVNVFFLATIPKSLSSKPEDERMTGLNIGVAIPFADAQQSESFFQDFCGGEWGFFGVCLNSDEGFRIPLVVHAGNYWSAQYGSACLFGYFSPGYFEERPKPNPRKEK